ncbi:acetyltransferase, N-acetylglutamate synthase [Salinarchaeum sp. Harcht-Bsk1]|uniref:GNAT family N-acetyltransferase n=1 Tax=Salinarchaeum sp. Harcht-Bsk1 TaxID=1333523 RepID=UPI0003422F8D|nr:GNAT family N-acetyltransferase [Salinarchaeum sp. Harcht-Bsk1]AGN00878.1 acetyltransferase, N-acetylglutamate synthase [Salinarchaeum sp. Harcht-Bsk1]
MEIRQPAGLDDFRAAIDAHNRAWRVGYRGIVSADVIDAQVRPTEEEYLEELDEDVAAEPGPFLVAETDDGDVVGFVRARYTGTSAFVAGLGGEIRDLYVDPAHWREGVGSALLASAVEWLPDMIDGISVAVLVDNERARSFLEANDLVFEETTDIDLAGDPHEHAVYRIGFED